MCEKRKKNKKKKTKKLSQLLKSHISGMTEAISLKFGMWSTEGGGNVHSKICLVSSRQHRATEVRKLRFLSSCQYTHGVARRLLGPHDTLPCVLMVPRTPAINYHLKSQVSIPLRCQLCSTRYTALQIKNCLKSTSAIKVATMKNTDDFLYKGKLSCVTATFCCQLR